MRKITIKSVICVTVVIFGLSATTAAQQCGDTKYYPMSQKNGWLSSDFYKVIDMDAASLTDAKYPRTGALDGIEDNVDYGPNTLRNPTGDGVITVPLYDDGGTDYIPSGYTYDIKYVRCVFAPDHFTSAWTKIDQLGQQPSGNSECTRNDNTVLVSNVFKKQGFVELSRQAASVGEVHDSKCGYIQLDNLYGVERVQWSFSSTSWKRGVICEVREGGEGGQWLPQRIIPSETANYATFAEQGYEFEESFNRENDTETPISIRFRIFDCDTLTWAHEKDLATDKKSAEFYYARLGTALQPVRIHQIRVFSSLTGSEIAQKITTGIATTSEDQFVVKKSGTDICASEECVMELYTIDGKMIRRENGTRMDVSGLNKGFYVVKATQSGGKVRNIKISL